MNRYVGTQEYIIIYKDGTHEVREIVNLMGDYEVVFRGFYEACLEKLASLENEYQDSRF